MWNLCIFSNYNFVLVIVCVILNRCLLSPCPSESENNPCSEFSYKKWSKNFNLLKHSKQGIFGVFFLFHLNLRNSVIQCCCRPIRRDADKLLLAHNPAVVQAFDLLYSIVCYSGTAFKTRSDPFMWFLSQAEIKIVNMEDLGQCKNIHKKVITTGLHKCQPPLKNRITFILQEDKNRLHCWGGLR